MIEIRTLRVEEFEKLMRFIERAFGHSVGFFQRVYPHLYRPTPGACDWAYVIEEEGEILSHVGLYPIEVVTAGVALKVGGIGAVATAPEARGHGYMTALLQHAIAEMRRLDYPVAWLGGDRQRYNTFGWENAAPAYHLTFSRRSLNWADVTPTPVEEVPPWEAEAAIAEWMPHPDCHARRPRLTQQLHKQGLRVWLAEDESGYVIAQVGNEEDDEDIQLIELVSASGDEVGLIRAVLDWTFEERTIWTLSAWDATRIARVMPAVAAWRLEESGMYRVNDLTALLQAAQPWLHSRAAGLRDNAVCIEVTSPEASTLTTLSIINGQLEVRAGCHAKPRIELSPVLAARLCFGGPAIPPAAELPPGLRALFPVPIFIPPLDHV